jgi:hypothetical protein
MQKVGGSRRQALPEQKAGIGAVKRIDVQAGRATGKQALAQGRNHIQSKVANGRTIVTITFKPPLDPPGDFRPADT